MKIEGYTDFGRVTVDIFQADNTPFRIALIAGVMTLLVEVEGDETSLRIDGQAYEVRDSVNLHSFEMLWQEILDFTPKTRGEQAAVNAALPFIAEGLEGFRDGWDAERVAARSASTRPENARPRSGADGVKIERARELVDSIAPPRMSQAFAESLRLNDDDQPNDESTDGDSKREAPKEKQAAPQKPAKREGVRRLGDPRPEPPAPPERVRRFPGQALQRARVKGAVRRLGR